MGRERRCRRFAGQFGGEGERAACSSRDTGRRAGRGRRTSQTAAKWLFEMDHGGRMLAWSLAADAPSSAPRASIHCSAIRAKAPPVLQCSSAPVQGSSAAVPHCSSASTYSTQPTVLRDVVFSHTRVTLFSQAHRKQPSAAATPQTPCLCVCDRRCRPSCHRSTAPSPLLLPARTAVQWRLLLPLPPPPPLCAHDANISPFSTPTAPRSARCNETPCVTSVCLLQSARFPVACNLNMFHYSLYVVTRHPVGNWRSPLPCFHKFTPRQPTAQGSTTPAQTCRTKALPSSTCPEYISTIILHPLLFNHPAQSYTDTRPCY